MAVRAPPPPTTGKGGYPSAAPAAAAQAPAAAPAPRPNPWILRPEELERSPSRADGVAAALEKGYRRKTCFFIDECGLKLKLHRMAVATAHVFLHRFFARQSFRKHDRFTVAQACVFLAAKVEEHPQKLQKVLLACHEVRFRAQGKTAMLDPKSEEFAKAKEAVLKSERILLNSVSFDLDIEHAFEPVISLIKKLRRSGHITESEQRDFAQAAINFLNDSMRTSLCLQFEPPKIASALIFLTFVYLRKLPAKGPMLEQFWRQLSISERSLHSICEQVMELYESNSDFSAMRAALHGMGHLPKPAPAPAPPAGGGAPAAPMSSHSTAQRVAPAPARPPPPPAPGAPPPVKAERPVIPPPPVPIAPPPVPAAPSAARLVPPPPVPTAPPATSKAEVKTEPMANGGGPVANGHAELKRAPPASQPGLGAKRLRTDSAGGSAALPLGVGSVLPTPQPLSAATAPVSS